MAVPVPARFDDLDLAAPARRAAAHMIKTRARHYGRRPLALDALHPGLGMAPPATLIAIAAHLVERESRSPRRWFGFGGEVSLVNARAALLLGRALRRAERVQPAHLA
jgi:hypothetical protein